MYILGLDIGTSCVKASIYDAMAQKTIVTVQYPDQENPIKAVKAGWAEQDPQMWWEQVQQAILKLHTTQLYDPKTIQAIGIAYQMHGLVCLDAQDKPLRDSIIWCDSRAVEIGEAAFEWIGQEKCLSQLLNSPGNFTASKLAWVKENEPETYEKIKSILLPGDYISMCLTGEKTTTISALSEGVFWDFKEAQLSEALFHYFGFEKTIIPTIQPVFSTHGKILPEIAAKLGLSKEVQVTYKAGDQPNNALSLNVLNPGEVAATAGTSGVVYGVTDQLAFDMQSRINSFAHVNHSATENRVGVLLCINGTGIANKWIKNNSPAGISYAEMNAIAAKIKPGSEGVHVFPFGNGAERMLQNKVVNAQINGVNFNVHNPAHLYRATQEGIAFAFKYGLDIMQQNGMKPSILKAGHANLFLSDVFVQSLVNTTNIPVELYQNDGSTGAAIGAAIGLGVYKNTQEAFSNMKAIRTIVPDNIAIHEALYANWKTQLLSIIQ
jgi:xylulokinase